MGINRYTAHTENDYFLLATGSVTLWFVNKTAFKVLQKRNTIRLDAQAAASLGRSHHSAASAGEALSDEPLAMWLEPLCLCLVN